MSHVSEIDETHARFMHAIASNLPTNHLIVPEPHETRLPVGKPISRITLCMSNAHLGVAPPPFQLWSHAVDNDPSNDEAPPPLAATDILYTSTAPPPAASTATSDSKIVDAIAVLFTYMNVIHKDLIEALDWCMSGLISSWSIKPMTLLAFVTCFQPYLLDILSLSLKLMISLIVFDIDDFGLYL
ncbi:hypothetical protein Acr_05g0012400 [Actinidia rufa]|uniref:Uncharacterized protein n=1 Tax=Actinidia rufa TaxID=165716 RepID=A0A7J0EM99_9ERIC|nr:hypothetical protein Acr_05g0012400 [Actinidia rufa]